MNKKKSLLILGYVLVLFIMLLFVNNSEVFSAAPKNKDLNLIQKEPSIIDKLLQKPTKAPTPTVIPPTEVAPKVNTRNVRNIESLKNKPVILFTFDDGPSATITPRLLDELNKRDIRVTFFALGSNINRLSDIVKRQYMDGHTVANHTYNHQYLTELTIEEAINEIDTTNNLINNILGINNKFVRVPYGHINDNILNASQMTYVKWSIDTRDWQTKDIENIYNTIIAQAKDGAIVLLHDLYETSVDGAIKAIDELLRQGYALISLEEAEQLGYLNQNLKTFLSIR